MTVAARAATAAPLTAALLAATLLGWASIGCGPTPVPWVADDGQLAASLDYDDALDSWTRRREVYEAFESRVFAHATYVSPAFAAVWARFRAERLGLAQEAAAADRATIVGRAQGEARFFVAVSTNDPFWNDLHRTGGSLRATLGAGTDEPAIPALSVTRLSNDEVADARIWFPYLDPLTAGYWVVFALPEDHRRLHLRIAGPPAVIDLAWETR